MREANFPVTHEQCAEKMLGKNRRKKMRQIVFYIHTNIVFKKTGQKIARNNFCRKTRIVRKKMLGKSSEKVRKNVFYIQTNTVTKKRGQKLHETIFPETHEQCELKMLGKKSSVKIAKKLFLYSHEYRDKKMGGKKCAKQFFQKHKNNAIKK